MAAAFMFVGLLHAETVNTNADLPSSKKTATYLHSRPMFEAMYRLGVEQDRKFGLQLIANPSTTSNHTACPFCRRSTSQTTNRIPRKASGISVTSLSAAAAEVLQHPVLRQQQWGSPDAAGILSRLDDASPVLVKDAMLSAIMGAVVRSGLKDCKDFDVFDMRVTEPAHDVIEGDKTIKGVWNEIWTLRVCRQAIDVAMTFIPDANGGGTSFTTGPAKVGDATAKP